MNSPPSLPTYNRFDVLSIQESNETVETIDKVVQNSESFPSFTPTSPLRPDSRPKWERKLPSKFIVAATEGTANSLKLKVELETTDTAEIKSTNALVDSGATGEFINRHYAKSCRFHLLKLSKPIPVFNIDGTPNEAGSITEVVDLIFWYKNHSEQTLFAVSNLRKQKLILGHSWLYKHNPEINWETVRGQSVSRFTSDFSDLDDHTSLNTPRYVPPHRRSSLHFIPTFLRSSASP